MKGNTNEPMNIDKGLTFYSPEGIKSLLPTPLPERDGHLYIGCEIEVVGGDTKNLDLLPFIHQIAPDLSVDGGMEFSLRPASGASFGSHVDLLFDALKYNQWETTDKCGLHFHVEIPDAERTDETVRRLLITCHALESELLKLSHTNDRLKNYAVPLRELFTKTLPHQVPENEIDDFLYFMLPDEEYLNGDNLDGLKKDDQCKIRYMGTNVHSVYNRGTVEFRYPDATLNQNDAEAYGLMCAGIVEHVLSSWWNEEEILSITSPKDFLLYLDTPSMVLMHTLYPNFVKHN